MDFYLFFWFPRDIATRDTKFEPKIPPDSLRITQRWSSLLQMVNLSKCYRMLMNWLARGS
jgi:hypothetical protein